MTQGMLWWFFWLTAMVTTALAPLVLWRYASGVLRGMRQRTAHELPLPPAARPFAPAAEHALGGGVGPDRARWDRVLARRVVLCWLLSFALAGLLLAPALAAPTLEWTPMGLLATALATMLPTLPTLAVALGWSRRALLGWGLAVLLAALALLAVGLVAMVWRHGAQVSWPLMLQATRSTAAQVLLLTWQPILLMLVCGAGRVRGVMPVMFAALLVFAAGPFLGAQLIYHLGGTEAGTRLMLQTGVATPEPLFVVLAVPFALIAWGGLRLLSTAYRNKKFSDLQLLAQAWWLMTVLPLALPAAGREATWLWCASVVASLALFGWVQRGVFAAIGPTRGSPPAHMLLVLRVFGWRSRTQRLFDRVVARWRLHGPVTVVAAPDAVARTIDPADFVEWLVGRHEEAFVRDAAELQARLAAIDTVRDPDARFRITEFCCADNSWKAAVVALMDRADAVLMDLRGATPDRAGCEFELRQLAARVDPRRVVLLVDQGESQEILRAWLGQAAESVRWLEVPRSSRSLPTSLLPSLFDAGR